MEKSLTNYSQICPNRVNVTPIGELEPEYACGCPVGEGCNIEYLPASLYEEMIAEYQKKQPDWDIYLDEQQLASMQPETPNQQKRRRSRAKKVTTMVIEGISK